MDREHPRGDEPSSDGSLRARGLQGNSHMGTLAIASSVLALALVVGCAQEETEQRTLRKPGTRTNVGADNDNGEHGSNTPAGDDDPIDPGEIVGSGTWADGKTITSNITIDEGATIEIAAGATVTVSEDVAITVKGTLEVAAGATHAKLIGTGWTGLIIGKGGTLDVDGLDIEGSVSGLWTRDGNAMAEIKNGVINADSPFKMEKNSKLTVTKTKVQARAGGSAIAGTFVASFMVYDKGANGGLTLNDPAGSMTISDSELRGTGGGDYLISSKGKLVKLEYTTISGSHCAIHFTGIDQFTIDHVSADANDWGAMLYGSGAGPHTITESNIRNNVQDLDLQNTNGPLTVTKTLSTKNKNLDSSSIIHPAVTPIANARPRAAP